MNDPIDHASVDHPSVDHPGHRPSPRGLDAAWKGIGALGQMEGVRRDRVVAELRTAVPDVASRAAREVGTEAVVAEISRFADVGVPGTDPAVPAAVIWDDVVQTAAEAARATR
ncbi:hypothetical protein QP157_18130 [Sphingomonas sp. LR61]|uniref:hypothetical protein n=1 Tax=Sphingomonas sp. LR61 TaxID=3050234 RepID=UPI002FDF41B3